MIAAKDGDWEVVGDARDGYEALELLEQLRPDIVLTDIRMPRMDGIQLQNIVRDRFQGMLCVVISGYDDFTYVKQSLRHGAIDYLMKPVERAELFQVLDRLQEKLKSAAAQKPSAAAADERQDDYQARRHTGDHLVASLNRNQVGQQDLDLLARIGIQFDDPYYASLVIKLDKQSIDSERYSSSDPSLFQLYIQQFVQEILDNRCKGFSFVYSDTEVVAFVNLPDPDGSRTKLLEIAESICRQIKSLSNMTVTIGVGRPVKGFELVPITFGEASIALLYRLVVGGDKVLDYEHTSKDNHFKTSMKKWKWEALEGAINGGRTDEIGACVETAIADLCSQAQTPETVHQHICKLFIHYYELSEDLGIARSWLGTQDIRTLIIEVCAISSQDELIAHCKDLFGRLTASIASGQQHVERDPIQKAIRYLERHYAEPITLKEIADHVFLNTAYFSTLFKQKTGSTFVEHLSGIRIEEAKRRLLLTEEKITSIAERTGFANIRHFNRVFKTETSMTPKDYREQSMNLSQHKTS